MNFADFSLRKSTITWFLTVLVVIGGVWAYGRLGKLEDPSFTIKTAAISTTYPGASPEVVENDVSTPIETAIQGRPEEGELEGFDLEYAVTVEYTYQSLTAFSDSDFVLEIPENANLEIVVHELALDRPWAEQADWGRYWLGRQVGEWSLARAEHMIYKVNPGFGAQPHDEHISLIYRRSEATNPNETIQLTIEPLSDRPIEGPRDFAEQRVASGDWVCREMALAGRSATVYSGVLEGGANDHIDTFYIFLPDAFVNIQLWAPVDPQLVLESLSPVD